MCPKSELVWILALYCILIHKFNFPLYIHVNVTFQICSTMGEGVKPPDEVEKILRLYMEWILFSESQVTFYNIKLFCTARARGAG